MSTACALNTIFTQDKALLLALFISWNFMVLGMVDVRLIALGLAATARWPDVICDA